MRIIIRAVGQLKAGPEKNLCDQYLKRLTWPVTIQEYSVTSELLRNLSPQSTCIALDEKGALWTSPEFADVLRTLQNQSTKEVVFFIGGADGLNDEIRKRCQYHLALGRLTWPHLLVRGLLVEQLYRCQQILAGHPYHRG